MTDRKTLQLRAPSETADPPALKKRGRGWEISEKRLDVLHEQAREMRRHSSQAHRALAERFAKADLGPYKFTRHAVVGSAIVDFCCHNIGMAIAIDEEGANETIATRRDKSLEAVNIRVMRIKAADILADIDTVLARITAGMRLRIADRGKARRDHHASNPRQTAPRTTKGSRPNRTSNAANR
jgi:very-short-patch-repair endonuclease